MGTSRSRLLKNSLRFALIAPGEDGYVAETPFVASQKGFYDHLRMRSLAGSTNGDIADTDCRHLRFLTLDKPFPENVIPKGERQGVWKQQDSVYHLEDDLKIPQM